MRRWVLTLAGEEIMVSGWKEFTYRLNALGWAIQNPIRILAGLSTW
jgi:hypothetical protein